MERQKVFVLVSSYVGDNDPRGDIIVKVHSTIESAKKALENMFREDLDYADISDWEEFCEKNPHSFRGEEYYYIDFEYDFRTYHTWIKEIVVQ